MLSRLIVHLYPWIIEIYLWFALLVAGAIGYFLTVPLLSSTGAILENEAVWQIYGALFFAVLTLLSAAAVIGPFLMLVDIRRSLKALETTSNSGGNRRGAISAEVKEPYL